MTEKKRIIDHTGIKIYTISRYDRSDENEIRLSTHTDDYILVSDFENLIRKLGKPEVLQKVIKSVMFGSADNFDLALLLSAPDQDKK